VITLQASPFRSHLENLFNSATQELFVASPYIKTPEAEWVCGRIDKLGCKKTIRFQLLTDVRSANVLGGSLDMAALRIFDTELPNCEIVNLPRLHAKVYVADETSAIVTSANLTPSGLDSNLEYGIGIHDKETIRGIKCDLQRYATLGNRLTGAAINELEKVAVELRKEFQAIERSSAKRLRRKFNDTLRRADLQFLRAQVGARSAHGLFADSMLYLLTSSPMSTSELHLKLKAMLPELCDDRTELIIDGQHFGKKWKHVVRNAQVFLRRKGAIKLIGKDWHVNLPTNH
jgi:phosphatidylserine/phosphatidylglycerophosphate/cardiolipin synthase-like enzyme